MELTTPPKVTLPALSSPDDSFCLAILEYGGNLPAAWNSVFAPLDPEGNPIPDKNAGQKARRLLGRPEIAARIAELQAHVQENAFISLGSHLDQMARLRDLSATAGDFKSAIAAEKARGEVAGYYAGKGPAKSGEGDGRAAVTIVMQNTPASMAEWAAKHGAGAPIVIDMPK